MDGGRNRERRRNRSGDGMQIAIYMDGTIRSTHVARSMRQGIQRHGNFVTLHDRYRGVIADVAIAYGWTHEPIFTKYREAGKRFVFFDLGYWDRRPKANKRDGMHRVAIDDWDTAKNMRVCLPGDRFAASGIELQPWGSKGDQIIVAGMSDKAAGTHGFAPNDWEVSTIADLAEMAPHRHIHFRPKPTGDQKKIEPISEVLSRSHMLVTHHSNAAIDALIAGVPFHSRKGVGSIMTRFDLGPKTIDNPPGIEMEARIQFLQDVAYHQWRPSEMASGAAWEFIKCILLST